jgi:hypothetical protein
MGCLAFEGFDFVVSPRNDFTVSVNYYGPYWNLSLSKGAFSLFEGYSHVMLFFVIHSIYYRVFLADFESFVILLLQICPFAALVILH